MQKETSNLESTISWIKADKAYPKKSSTLFSFINNKTTSNQSLNNNPFNIGTNETDSDRSKSIDNDNGNRIISMKDLCAEDKQRIANLIKELAKMGEEKKQLEKSLEEERKQKDTEIKDVLKQQQVLLNEKEKLLNKYSKTQEKLEQLKRHQRLMKLESASESKSLPPKPVKSQPVKIAQQNDNNPFSPYTSSTPMSQSPRNMSPILSKTNPSQQFETEEMRKKSILNEDDDLKKIELIRQRMDLMNEQTKLKELLDQQEDMLKEKQNQIMLQQKLHRERLEQLSQIRSNEQEQQLYGSINYSSNFNPTHSINSYCSPNNFPLIDNCNHYQQPQIQQYQQFSNENNSQLIENITQQVFKQLLIKRQYENQSQNESMGCNANNSSINKSKHFVDEKIEHNTSTNNKQKKISKVSINNQKLVQTNSGLMKQSQIKQKVKIKNDFNEEDLEESKLIEDLFFLN